VGPDLPRVTAHHEGLELVHGGLAGSGEAVQRRLADAVDALVGEHADEEPVLPAGADRECLNVNDLHTALQPVRCAPAYEDSYGKATRQSGGLATCLSHDHGHAPQVCQHPDSRRLRISYPGELGP